MSIFRYQIIAYLHPLTRYLWLESLKFNVYLIPQIELRLKHRLKGKRLKHALLAALADTDLQRILDAAMYQSKSVNQIINETNVSHTTAYRKIKWLLEELRGSKRMTYQRVPRRIE